MNTAKCEVLSYCLKKKKNIYLYICDEKYLMFTLFGQQEKKK